MLKNLIKLADGTGISSGTGQTNAIQSCTITECVNSGEELTLGSTCCSCLEAKIFAPSGSLSIGAGTEITLCKVDDAGTETAVGVFALETPTRPSTNIYKITAYDRVAKLDKDLSDWLKGLTGWPYKLTTFAGMICKACGLTLAATEIPNGDFLVQQFYKAGVTGRQLMKWIGEIACRFCRANAKGEIEFGWYTDSGVTIQPTGDRYYFAGALTYEDYTVAAIDAVKLRLADSDNGALWPSGTADNPYIITSNPILLAQVTEDLLPVLQVIQKELAGLSYSPCKVSLPASMDIRAGNTVKIVDKNGKSITTCVMTKTQSGQRDTLECTGSAWRDCSTAVNNQSTAQIAQQAVAANNQSVTQIAQRVVAAQTQEEIFNKLTQNGALQGLFMKDGELYINASYLATGIIRSADGTVALNLSDGSVTINGVDNGKKTQFIMSADGIDGYSENSEGEMEHTLAFDFGSGSRPSGLWNLSYKENTGLSIGTATGELGLGTSEAVTRIYGSSIQLICAMLGAVLEVGLDSLSILGKIVSWKGNGDGTYTLIGT